MRLDDLVPYAGNPRDNDKVVDGVAASIEEFGFRGAIVCDREHELGAPEREHEASAVKSYAQCRREHR